MARCVPASQGSEPYADRRIHPRVQLELPAFLQANQERHAVHLLDLSAGGAKVNCPASLPAGTAVVLDCGTFGSSAVVRWQSGAMLGLCFDNELDAREVSALIERSRALAARMNK
jgi:hypothetical protein